MADKHFDEISEIRLPAKLLHRSVGVAFDVGTYVCSLPSGRQNLSNDDGLGDKRKYYHYQNCCVLCTRVVQSETQMPASAVLKVDCWFGFAFCMFLPFFVPVLFAFVVLDWIVLAVDRRSIVKGDESC